MRPESAEAVRDWCQSCGSHDLRPGASITTNGVTLAPVCGDCDTGANGCVCGDDHDCRAEGCDDACPACSGP